MFVEQERDVVAVTSSSVAVAALHTAIATVLQYKEELPPPPDPAVGIKSKRSTVTTPLALSLSLSITIEEEIKKKGAED